MDRKDASPSARDKTLIKFEKNSYTKLAISPDGKKLAYSIIGVHNKITIINLEDNTSTDIPPSGEVHELVWINDNNLVYTTYDGKLLRWDFAAWWTKERAFGFGAPPGAACKLAVIEGDRFITQIDISGPTFECNLTTRQTKKLGDQYNNSLVRVLSESEFVLLNSLAWTLCYIDTHKEHPQEVVFSILQDHRLAMKPTNMVVVSPDRVVIEYTIDTTFHRYDLLESLTIMQLWDIRTGKMVSGINIDSPPEFHDEKFGIKNCKVLRLPDCSHFVVACEADLKNKSLHGICLQFVETNSGFNKGCTYLPLDKYSSLYQILVNPANSHFIISDSYGIKDHAVKVLTYEESLEAITPITSLSRDPLSVVLAYLGLFPRKSAENKETSSAESKQKPTSESPKSGGK